MNREAHKALAEMYEKCYECGWTFQFTQVDGNHVKTTAFADETHGLSMTVDADSASVEQIAYMIRQLIKEVDTLAATETATGQNRTLPA